MERVGEAGDEAFVLVGVVTQVVMHVGDAEVEFPLGPGGEGGEGQQEGGGVGPAADAHDDALAAPEAAAVAEAGGEVFDEAVSMEDHEFRRRHPFIITLAIMDQASTQVMEIVCNLDDVTGEVIGAAVDALLEAGALDVWTTPITMKKQRPGVMLSLLCQTEEREKFARRVMELTGSFGVRFRAWGRMVLERRHETVPTEFGPVRLKVGTMEGRIVSVKPEFEDVRELAARSGRDVVTVMSAAKAAAEAWRVKQGVSR
jgi:hypothetical protein